MRIRTTRLIGAIMFFIASIGMPVYLIVLSQIYPENFSLGQGIFFGAFLFLIFISLGLFYYYQYKTDKDIEDQKIKRIKELEAELKKREDQIDN